ncbi:JAB domain-containing protein [Thermaurantiacus sp.]
MTTIAGRIARGVAGGIAGGPNAGMSRTAPQTPAAESRAGSRDRWLLMRLLSVAHSVPRLADRLIGERGSLGAVLALSDERLRQLGADANGIAIIALLREAVATLVEPVAPDRPRIESPAALVQLLFPLMAWLSVEQVRAVFLDSGQHLIANEIVSSGTADCAPLYPREIVRRALELSASAVVLVHNHPSGEPMPSASDREMTRRVSSALATVDIALLDHLVIGRSGWASAASPSENISTLRISNARDCRPMPASL